MVTDLGLHPPVLGCEIGGKLPNFSSPQNFLICKMGIESPMQRVSDLGSQSTTPCWPPWLVQEGHSLKFRWSYQEKDTLSCLVAKSVVKPPLKESLLENKAG